MIKTEILEDGRIHTWSDIYVKIQQETGVVYDDAIDVVEHTYTETDEPITDMDATEADYQAALNELGVDTSEEE